jgi:hypothetical protein
MMALTVLGRNLTETACAPNVPAERLQHCSIMAHSDGAHRFQGPQAALPAITATTARWVVIGRIFA